MVDLTLGPGFFSALSLLFSAVIAILPIKSSWRVGVSLELSTGVLLTNTVLAVSVQDMHSVVALNSGITVLVKVGDHSLHFSHSRDFGGLMKETRLGSVEY